MTPGPRTDVPAPKQSRAGRNLPAAIASAVVLLAAVAVSLATFDSFPFVFLAVLAVGVGIWEFRRAMSQRGIVLPHEPLHVGSANAIRVTTSGTNSASV